MSTTPRDPDHGTPSTRDRGAGPRHPSSTTDDDLEALLATAGPRPRTRPDRLGPLHGLVLAEWQAMARSARRRRRTKTLAVAAGLFAAVAAGWWLSRAEMGTAPAPTAATVVALSGELVARDRGGRQRTVSIGTPLEAGTGIESGPAGRAALRLPGGESVRVDTASRLILIAGARLSLERGAIYVDSQASTSRLAIATPLGEVRDIGTRFEVRVDSFGRQPHLRVRVRDGVVEVERPDGAEAVARAGDEVEVPASGEIVRRSSEPYGSEWDWILDVTPPVRLDGRPLSEVLAWICAERGWRLELPASLADGEVRVVGSLAGLDPDTVLEVVAAGAGLAHRVEDGALVLEPAR